MLFHSASIAALPFTMPEPGGNAVASSAYSDATPAKSPLLKKSIHFAFTASISAFWANAGALSAARKAITAAILRMVDGLLTRGEHTPITTRPLVWRQRCSGADDRSRAERSRRRSRRN